VADEKKTEVATSEKNFRSKVHAFPPDIIDEIDKSIAKGLKGERIRAFLVRTYKGPLEIPDRKTLDLYVKNRFKTAHEKAELSVKVKRELDYTDEELREMHRRLNVAGTDVSNRKGLLDKMVTLMLTRIQLTSQLQDRLLDPRVEHNIIKMVGEVRALTVQLMELENQLGVHEAVARTILEKFLAELAPVVRKAAEDTYGSSKTKEFIERLLKSYKTIDIDRIRNEAVLEVSNMEKEQLGVKKIGSNAA
jgi:hypothetical protein